ncbi:hypothetical protein NKH98_28925 [Mesorhizobium sp. M0833]|uniref:hypothetical protein n=1 Tax=Mesorhizobium sp. M0833 TaxID=2957009 RepID=UPI003335705B
MGYIKRPGHAAAGKGSAGAETAKFILPDSGAPMVISCSDEQGCCAGFSKEQLPGCGITSDQSNLRASLVRPSDRLGDGLLLLDDGSLPACPSMPYGRLGYRGRRDIAVSKDPIRISSSEELTGSEQSASPVPFETCSAVEASS